MNKSNRNLDKTNTNAGTTKEVSRASYYRTSITGGNCGGSRGNGNSNGNSNSGGTGIRPLEDGGEDIFF